MDKRVYSKKELKYVEVVDIKKTIWNWSPLVIKLVAMVMIFSKLIHLVTLIEDSLIQVISILAVIFTFYGRVFDVVARQNYEVYNKLERRDKQ